MNTETQRRKGAKAQRRYTLTQKRKGKKNCLSERNKFPLRLCVFAPLRFCIYA